MWGVRWWLLFFKNVFQNKTFLYVQEKLSGVFFGAGVAYTKL